MGSEMCIRDRDSSLCQFVLEQLKGKLDLHHTSLTPVDCLAVSYFISCIKVKYLDVSHCGMTDTGVASLADALHTNNTLETLDIDGNDALTENGLTCLVEVLSRNSGVVELWLPMHLRSSVDKVRKTVNEARKRSGLVAIKVWGKYYER